MSLVCIYLTGFIFVFCLWIIGIGLIHLTADWEPGSSFRAVREALGSITIPPRGARCLSLTIVHGFKRVLIKRNSFRVHGICSYVINPLISEIKVFCCNATHPHCSYSLPTTYPSTKRTFLSPSLHTLLLFGHSNIVSMWRSGLCVVFSSGSNLKTASLCGG